MTPHQQLSENEIIDRIINGDIAFFEVLIRRYNAYLYKIGRSYGYNHHDVEDLMQETFINAYLNLDKVENKAYFKSWLIRIMLNECYRKRQKTNLRKEIAVDTFLHEKTTPMFSDNKNDDTAKNVGNRELDSVIENAIQRIPAHYRIVFILREINRMTVLETAEVLHITQTNVKVRLNRAKTLLRKEVEKMYSPDEIFSFNLIYCDKIVLKVMEKIIL